MLFAFGLVALVLAVLVVSAFVNVYAASHRNWFDSTVPIVAVVALLASLLGGKGGLLVGALFGVVTVVVCYAPAFLSGRHHRYPGPVQR